MSIFERIKCYSREQLEPASRLVLSLLVTLFIDLLIRKDHSISSRSYIFLIPALSTFTLLLYYRISDEFKDFETDKKFFPDRPIPSGRLFLRDLTILLVIVAVSGFLLNLIFRQAIKEYLVAFLFTFAMGKWFFMEKVISKNRLLAFATHAPVGLFLYWYAEVFLLNTYNVEWSAPDKLSVIGFIVLPGLSWEILRKTYRQQDEMPGYQTYSTMLGFRGSLAFASLWIVITIINNFLLLSLFDFMDPIGLPLLLINLILLCIVIAHGINPRLKNLKPIAEIYMALHLLVPLGYLLSKGWRYYV